MHKTTFNVEITHQFVYTLYITTAIKTDSFSSLHKSFIYNLLLYLFRWGKSVSLSLLATPTMLHPWPLFMVTGQILLV